MVTLTALCAEYLSQRRYDLEDSTRDITARACRWFDMARARKTLDQLTPADGDRYKTWLIDTGRCKNTANMYLRSVQVLTKWAVQRGLIDADPLAGVKQFRVTRKPVRVFENWQFERLLRYCPDDLWRAILWMARTTGFRRGELLNLTRENLRDGFAWVEPKEATDRTWPWEPKDKEVRHVPYVDRAREAIGQLSTGHYVLLPWSIEASLLRMQQNGILKSERCRRPLNNFNRTFNRIQFVAFGRRIGKFHQLRSTYITEACEDLPEHFVIRLTGHSSTRTLTHYTAARESYFEIARQTASRVGKKEGSTRDATAANPVSRDGTHWAVQDLNL